MTEISWRERFAHHAPSLSDCLHMSRTDLGIPNRGDVSDSGVTHPLSDNIIRRFELKHNDIDSRVSSFICCALECMDKRRSLLALDELENFPAKALNPEEGYVDLIKRNVSSWYNMGSTINRRGIGVGSWVLLLLSYPEEKRHNNKAPRAAWGTIKKCVNR